MNPPHNPGREQREAVLAMRRDLLAGRWEMAFSRGEEILDAAPLAETYESLIALIGRNFAPEMAFALQRLLARLNGDPSGSYGPWRSYLRYVLLDRLGWAEAGGLGSELMTLPVRYAWMRFDPITTMLNHQWAFAHAARILEGIARDVPRFWKAAAKAAECHLCLGDDARAFALFDRCVDEVSRSGTRYDLVNAKVWRGELKLWIGRYEEALRELDPLADDAEVRRWNPDVAQLALGWRGAARLQVGEAAAARDDLSEALRLDSRDGEAILWRGEALLALGDLEASRADVDQAVRMTPSPLWPHVLRALLRARSGDEAGFWEDYKAVPGRLTGLFQSALGLPPVPDLEGGVVILSAMRDAARGLRRSERYLYPLWLPRTFVRSILAAGDPLTV